MDPIAVGVLGVAGLLFLILIGFPVVFAAALTGFLGMSYLKGFGVATNVSGLIPYDSTANYALSVLPLFILIGFLANSAGMINGAYRFARVWFGWLPGGLGVATIFASAGFGAVSGASTATAAVFSRVAIPELTKSGYTSQHSAALVAASGTLASLIPPSTILVVYAIIVEESIGKLLLAGFIPGLFSALIYAGYIVFSSSVGGSNDVQVVRSNWKERLNEIPNVLPIVAVIVVIILGMSSGWSTPTEAGAMGAGIVFVFFLFSRHFSIRELHTCLMDSIRLTVMIFATIWGVLILARFLAFSGLPGAVAAWIVALDMPASIILLFILLGYVILGMFMNAIGMLLLTLPIIFPAVVQLGFDPVWFGILVVKVVEIGLITPPIGLNCFVVAGVRPDIPLSSIFRGVLPFLAMDGLTLLLLFMFPIIVLWLPSVV
ncbi:TRAP transporter large permease [Microbulbifer sp. S227A]|uniref:TRAP transporter large permease n=1 Tax=Microbulbifer sp. S227A TaxID=3415131 RepID=UPI003C7B9BF2